LFVFYFIEKGRRGVEHKAGERGLHQWRGIRQGFRGKNKRGKEVSLARKQRRKRGFARSELSPFVYFSWSLPGSGWELAPRLFFKNPRKYQQQLKSGIENKKRKNRYLSAQVVGVFGDKGIIMSDGTVGNNAR
jgi:hypothetical protein